jgi:AraC-like DNA-binding protein
VAPSPATRSLYREVDPPPHLGDALVCSWVGSVGPEGPPEVDRVLPDGCVDVIWDGQRLFVAGPDLTAEQLERAAGSTMVGVRLRPGRAPALLRVGACELTDMRVDLNALWGGEADELAERLDATPTPDAARCLLEWRVAARVAPARDVDPVIGFVADVLARDPSVTINRLACEMAISRRQLQRRALVALGYGPKTFARIMRFQCFVGLGRADRDGQLARLARDAGYADQAHLTRECRRLSGLTPQQLLSWQRGVAFVQDVSGVRAVPLPM